MASEVYLTKEGIEKLKEELARLNRQKSELSKEIGETREQGDLRENAGYHAARDKQRMVLGRIEELQLKLSNAKVVDDKAAPCDEVRLGATVTFKDETAGKEARYTLVSADEADLSQNRLSVQSPLAQGLLGAKAGTKVRVKLPNGERTLSVLRVEYK